VVDVAPHIVTDHAIRKGQPVIRGTRVPVAIVVGRVGAGESIEAVADDYGITRDDVLAALAYAAKRIANEEIRAF
jgi:uncharacterized protein (DUF433 family)